ncbi:DUF4097 family beta strand repeat-containing protein [Actinomycetota bacterium Odt1-20B]
MSEWIVDEPRKLTFGAPLKTVRVRTVNGTVNVVGTDETSARLEISDIDGPALTVTHEDGTLSVVHDDHKGTGLFRLLDLKSHRRSAAVSLAVPAGTRVEVGAVGAAVMVSGIEGPAQVKTITGATTLVGLSGPVRADSVSGDVEMQGVSGDLTFKSVSGDLTVMEGAGPSVRAESVSGSMIVDLDPADRPADVTLLNVSGEIAIRIPHPADAEVEANTASGSVSNAFEDLRVGGQWGAKKITGRLGEGRGKLRATTVSGSIALLRRPPAEEDPHEPTPPDGTPTDESPTVEAPTDRTPSDTSAPTDKKVL